MSTKRYTTCRHCGVIDVQDIKYKYGAKPYKRGRVQRAQYVELMQHLAVGLLAVISLAIILFI